MSLKKLVKRRWKNRVAVPLVEVLWWDAVASFGNDWGELPDAKRAGPARSLSVGYLLVDTPTHVTISSLVNEDQLGHVLVIPKGMIEDIRTVISV